MKKVVSIILAMILSVWFILSSSAEMIKEDEYYYDINLNTALSSFEQAKENIGLAEVNFRELTIGEPIKSYIYSEQGLTESFQFYPLFYNSRLVLFAIKNNVHYTITDSLIDQFSRAYQNGSSYAFLYDNNSCYLYNGDDFFLLVNHGMQLEGRLDLANNPLESDKTQSMELTPLKTRKKLNYSKFSSQQRYGSSAYVSVPTVSQGSYNSICWAASSASIINCLKGTNYSAVYIAVQHYGTVSFNQGLDASYIPSVLYTNAVYNYQYIGYVPTYQKILQNLGNSYPVYGSFTTGAQTHGVVVWGIDVYNTITLMDPQYGTNYSAQYGYNASGSYVPYLYVNSSTGLELWMGRAVLRYT